LKSCSAVLNQVILLSLAWQKCFKTNNKKPGNKIQTLKNMLQKQCILRIYLIVFAVNISLFKTYSQEFIPLWPNGKMPNSKGMQLKDSIANERIYRVGTPGMYAFFPSQQENKGAAVVICPGGGYERLAYIISGTQLQSGLIQLA